MYFTFCNCADIRENYTRAHVILLMLSKHKIQEFGNLYPEFWGYFYSFWWHFSPCIQRLADVEMKPQFIFFLYTLI